MPVVWIISAEQWPRAMLRAELIDRGLDAVGYMTVRDAVESLTERRPEIIVVELRGQPVAQVERLLDLHVPVLLVGGAADLHDLPDREWAAVLRRPVSIGEIAERVVGVT